MLLSSGIVWLVATVVFVVSICLFLKQPWWLAFVYAVPINAIVVTVLAAVWKYKLTNFGAVTYLSGRCFAASMSPRASSC